MNKKEILQYIKDNANGSIYHGNLSLLINSYSLDDLKKLFKKYNIKISETL